MTELMPPDVVDKIISGWSTLMDTWAGDTGPAIPYEYPHEVIRALRPATHKWRPLPEHEALLARQYINHLCKSYPLQLRSGLGLAMWLRFTDVWASTGDPVKSMRAI